MPTGHEALVKGLEHEWPRYLGYFVSFAFIGGVWIAHSNLTRFIKAADPDLMRLNLMLLLLVPFLPFTTAIAATHLFASHLSLREITISTSAERVAAVVFRRSALLSAAAASASVHSEGRSAVITGTSVPGEGSEAGNKMDAPRPIRPRNARTIMAIA